MRVSDAANQLFIYPPDSAERAGIVSTLAMRPQLFGEVLKKYPEGLPSDANLRAKLQLDWGFASTDAADTFIRALRDSMRVASVDQAPKQKEDSGNGNGQEVDPMTLPNPEGQANPPLPGQKPPLPAPPLPAPPRTEKHTWKLGEGVWADITITGGLSPKSFAKLKKYVELIDVSEEEGDEPE